MTVSDEELAQAREISVEQIQYLRSNRGTTNDTLSRLPREVLIRALIRVDYPDLPAARAEFRLQQALGDDGALPPPHALGRAQEQRRAMVERGAPAERTAGVPTGTRTGGPGGPAEPEAAAEPEAPGGPPPTAGLSLAGWEWLGPGNIGGRTRGIVVHPTQPDRMWAVSAGGGVWRTENGGQRWDPVDDFLDNLSCSCVAMDPSDPSTIYVGTGESFGNADAIRGNGLFRTTDGVTWASIPATRIPGLRGVNRIAVSADGRVVLAAGPAGIFRSTDAPRAQWDVVLPRKIGYVGFHPTDSAKAVAGTLDGEALFSGDGGATWTASTHPSWSGRVELAYAAKDPETVYASVEMRDQPEPGEMRGTGRIWRSADGGRTYQARDTLALDGHRAKYLATQGWYGNTIWAGDPEDENLLILGGVNLWRSDDGGNELREISTWQSPESAHADQHAIVSHPDYGAGHRILFFGNDGGVIRGDLDLVGTEPPDKPFVAGWTELVNNYGVTQFYGGAGNSTSGTIVGGAQDNGSLCFTPANGTERWSKFFGGDGGWCASDPDDENFFYGEYVFLAIHRSTDGASTNGELTGENYIHGRFFNPALGPTGSWDWKPPPFRIEDAKNGPTDRTALFIAPFVIDPNDSDRLYAGGQSLWRTDDAKTPNTLTSGPKWLAVKLPADGNALISALAATPGAPGTVWVGHTDGKVFRSTDATAAAPTWQQVGTTGTDPLQPQRVCTCITVHPAHRDTVYVCFGGFEHDNLWVTEDAGAHWRSLAAALPQAPIRALAVHPAHERFLYCGTEVGLFASEDAGATWSPTNEGPANCSVEDLFWMKDGGADVLVCVTHGRGMFRIKP